MTSPSVGQTLGLALFMALFALTTTATVKIDGEWSPWSQMATPCSKSCGGGEYLKVRSCTNPSPQNGGDLCMKMDKATKADKEWHSFDCNTQSCWGLVWGQWGNCSVPCGKGQSTRVSMCGIDICVGDMAKNESKFCNDWNKTTCPSPCEDMTCPQFGVCEDESTEKEPIAYCVCTMGYEMNSDKTACIRPPPTTPTPRPIPTLPAEQKVVATVISKSASTLIIILVSITLGLFIFLRVYTIDRVIQMNMEIALLCAHVMLVIPGVTEYPAACKTISILTHFFFTACFMFMLLESLHMYSLVAFIVKQDGMFNKIQNTVVGWGTASIVILTCVAFELDNYGGEYHCWLRMDTPLIYGQFIPIIIMTVLTFALTEAAGAVNYKPLKGIDKTQLRSAKFSQRTNLIILPLVFAHWMVGMLSEYEQNLPLYGTFSVLNGVTGFAVFLLHSSCNTHVREKLQGCWWSMCKGSSIAG